MKRTLPCAALLLLLLFSWSALAGPRVRMHTNLGEIVLELNDEKAPLSVANFLAYARDGFYDGTIFHRVIDGFMIQGGGFSADFRRKPTREPIENEAANGLKNARGSIAMARTAQPHSATAQFFINVADNDFLNHPGHDGWGYAVFGRVVEGMEVVDEIRQLPTGPAGPFAGDVPQETVLIETVEIVSEDSGNEEKGE